MHGLELAHNRILKGVRDREQVGVYGVLLAALATNHDA